jgi:hypothetical protein
MRNFSDMVIYKADFNTQTGWAAVGPNSYIKCSGRDDAHLMAATLNGAYQIGFADAYAQIRPVETVIRNCDINIKPGSLSRFTD